MNKIVLVRSVSGRNAAAMVAAGISPQLMAIKPGTRRHAAASRSEKIRKTEDKHKHRNWC